MSASSLPEPISDQDLARWALKKWEGVQRSLRDLIKTLDSLDEQLNVLQEGANDVDLNVREWMADMRLAVDEMRRRIDTGDNLQVYADSVEEQLEAVIREPPDDR